MRVMGVGIAAVVVIAALGATAPLASASSNFSPAPGSPYSGTAVAVGTAGVNSVSLNMTGSLAAVSNYGANTVTISKVGANGQPGPTTDTVPVSSPLMVRFIDGTSTSASEDLAVLSQSGGLFMYIVSSDGSVTPVAGSPFAADGATSMATGGSAGALAIATVSPAGIDVFGIGSDGTLLKESTTADSDDPVSVSVGTSQADTSVVAVANAQSGTVGYYSLAADGALALITNYALGAPAHPDVVAFNPSQPQLLEADLDTDTINSFTASASGLVLQSSTSAETGTGIRALAFGGGYFTGQLLAVAEVGVGIGVYPILPTGSLYTQSSLIPTADTPTDLAFAPSESFIAASDPTGDSLGVYALAPPSVLIHSPKPGAVYTLGQTLTTSVTCSDSQGAPGIGTCGPNTWGEETAEVLTGSEKLVLRHVGTFTYSATTESADHQTATATVTYRVVAPTISIQNRVLTAQGQRTHVIQRCHNITSAGSCSGVVTITTVHRIGKNHRRQVVTLGRVSYKISSGHSAIATVKLNATGRNLIAASHDTLAVDVTSTTTDAKTVSRKLTLE